MNAQRRPRRAARWIGAIALIALTLFTWSRVRRLLRPPPAAPDAATLEHVARVRILRDTWGRAARLRQERRRRRLRPRLRQRRGRLAHDAGRPRRRARAALAPAALQGGPRQRLLREPGARGRSGRSRVRRARP